jgi:chromatin segregation and condensation protein Rec8/ScpA/Scc1 (kleisin family)
VPIRRTPRFWTVSLPEAAGRGAGGELRHKAALASTLLAGLELGREGAASLRQGSAFGAIVVAPAGMPDPMHGGARAEETDRAGRLRADPAEG